MKRYEVIMVIRRGAVTMTISVIRDANGSEEAVSSANHLMSAAVQDAHEWEVIRATWQVLPQ